MAIKPERIESLRRGAAERLARSQRLPADDDSVVRTCYIECKADELRELTDQAVGNLARSSQPDEDLQRQLAELRSGALAAHQRSGAKVAVTAEQLLAILELVAPAAGSRA